MAFLARRLRPPLIVGVVGAAATNLLFPVDFSIGFAIFGFAISLVIYNAAELILQPEAFVINFIYAIILGFALLFALGVWVRRRRA